MRRDRTVGVFSKYSFGGEVVHKGICFVSLNDVARMYGVSVNALRYAMITRRNDPKNDSKTDCELVKEVVAELVKKELDCAKVTIK